VRHRWWNNRHDSSDAKRDQARIVHGEAVHMVQSSPGLGQFVQVFKDNLSMIRTNSVFDGEHNATYAEHVRRFVFRVSAGRRRPVGLRQLKPAVAVIATPTRICHRSTLSVTTIQDRPECGQAQGVE